MKSLTKLLIVVVVGVLIAGVVVRVIGSGGDSGDGAADALATATPLLSPTPPPTPTLPPKPLSISVIAALPVEPWVSSAADTYNNEEHYVSGRRVTVEVIPQEGLLALNKWAQGEFDPVPTAWLAESRAWVDQANIAALNRTRQDIFLAGGRYRAQPVVLSPLVWGIWKDRYDALARHSGIQDISWDEVHDAAVTGSWADLGGDEEWGRFKFMLAHPGRDPAGLTALVSAAGEYFDKPSVKLKDIQDAEFLSWLTELLDRVVAWSSFGMEDMLLFGPSAGDAGLGVESFLLTSMEGLQLRGQQPLEIVYPDPVAWFDFPHAVYMGKETSAEEKQAALDFKNYLLSADQQASALEFGLRPACVECPSGGGLIARWRDLGVSERIPSASRMRPAPRSGIEFLAAWIRTYLGQ